jgi:hypothetical protein
VLNLGVIKNSNNEITTNGLTKVSHHFKNLLLGGFNLQVQINKALNYNLKGTEKQSKTAIKGLELAIENYNLVTITGDLKTQLLSTVISKGQSAVLFSNRINSLKIAIDANNLLLPKMLQK